MNNRIIYLLIPVFLSITACSLKQELSTTFHAEKVEPWQRDVLAQESMQLQPDAIKSYADDHIYFSKEAATGGKGVGGGGCGCN
ncbi:MAG: DUF4266 domain-containing protein [Gammaproteobacteria bacterium]|nr:DUF4266 domain-containing protein [Gammaproteobacteria bacterium]